MKYYKSCAIQKQEMVYIKIYMKIIDVFYKGSNPDNYIIFNNEIWRILSAEADKTIKIIKNESIDNMSWDMSGSSYWSKPSDLNSYLNNEYLDTITTNQDKIVNYSWNIGKINIYGSEDFF